MTRRVPACRERYRRIAAPGRCRVRPRSLRPRSGCKRPRPQRRQERRRQSRSPRRFVVQGSGKPHGNATAAARACRVPGPLNRTKRRRVAPGAAWVWPGLRREVRCLRSPGHKLAPFPEDFCDCTFSRRCLLCRRFGDGDCRVSRDNPCPGRLRHRVHNISVDRYHQRDQHHAHDSGGCHDGSGPYRRTP